LTGEYFAQTAETNLKLRLIRHGVAGGPPVQTALLGDRSSPQLQLPLISQYYTKVKLIKILSSLAGRI